MKIRTINDIQVHFVVPGTKIILFCRVDSSIFTNMTVLILVHLVVNLRAQPSFRHVCHNSFQRF